MFKPFVSLVKFRGIQRTARILLSFSIVVLSLWGQSNFATWGAALTIPTNVLCLKRTSS
jgi:hypothetical protein